jgi:GT2 family glycosyltransferase
MPQLGPTVVTIATFRGFISVDLLIVIVSYNCRAFLEKCLSALPEACAGLSWRTVVVDNASEDASADVAEAAGVEVIRSGENLGFPRANNLALKDSDARYSLILNPDTEARPGSLRTLVDFMDSHSEAGACGPMLLNPDGSLQPNGRTFPTLSREFLAILGVHNRYPEYFRRLEFGDVDLTRHREVESLTGACLLVRGEVMEQVGLLDERFFMFYEDVEWCYRIRKGGWKVFYVPESQVVHHWMGSVRLYPRKAARALHKSQVQYFWLTCGPLGAAGAGMNAVLGIARNEIIHLGVAAKRRLRRAGILRDGKGATSI